MKFEAIDKAVIRNITAAMLASSLVLAGCGGGSSGGSGSQQPVDHSAELDTALEDVTKETETAETAVMKAKDGVTMLTTEEVAGESALALKAAIAIVSARGTVEKAIEESERALESAMMTQEKINALPDTDTQKSDLMTQASDAIEKIKEDIEAAKMLLEDSEFKEAEEMIADQEMARAIANKVGEDIAASLKIGHLVATRENMGRTSGVHGTEGPEDTIPTELVNKDDDQKDDETIYISYGYWLTKPTDVNSSWAVNTFANLVGTGTEANLAAGSTDEENKATYAGSAIGMSVHRTGENTDSGQFTADVNLTATFGEEPLIEGTINNFKGDATGQEWTVDLKSTPLSIVDESSGYATATDRDGQWTAQAYGTNADERPTGVFGGFAAHFTDGDVAGAYATRLDMPESSNDDEMDDN